MADDYFTRVTRDAEDRYTPQERSTARTAVMVGGGMIALGVALVLIAMSLPYGSSVALFGFLMVLLGVAVLAGGAFAGERTPARVVTVREPLPPAHVLAPGFMAIVSRAPVRIDAIDGDVCRLTVGGVAKELVCPGALVIGAAAYQARIVDGALTLTGG